ncbi:MAG TPA: alpha/beta hydrolase [Kiloniellaceae bacterium]|nr:alpha/beta hydrolase [Kiloniellaceae bacterium]
MRISSSSSTSPAAACGSRRIGAIAGPGPVLVFLHEALGSIGQWKGLPEELAERTGLPALAYERQGYGRSTPLTLPRDGDYLRQEAEVVLPAVLAACGIARPVLVGHSDGATIALMHAAAFPGVAAACVALAPHVMVEEVTLAGIRAADVDPDAAAIRRRLARYHGDRAETLWRAWTETWLRPGFAGCELRDRLARIACPTLVIQGADDAYGSTAQVELIAGRAGGPVETLLLPGCGHQPHLEMRAAVVERVAGFLDRLGQGGASAEKPPDSK